MTTEVSQKSLYEIFENHNANSKNTIEPEEVVSLVDEITALAERQSYNGKVLKFHQLFNQVINHNPVLPDKKTLILRLSLILEELKELAEAFGSEVYTEFGQMLFKASDEVRKEVENQREHLTPSVLKALDAALDLQYVLSGTIVACGFAKNFEEAFDEVHNSNMSKLCETQQEAENTCDHYKALKQPCTFTQKGDYYMVVRDGDGKVLKSINYSPAQLEKFLN